MPTTLKTDCIALRRDMVNPLADDFIGFCFQVENAIIEFTPIKKATGQLIQRIP
jgi:hypothetical protein